jgi:hypothetical protein
LHFPEGNEENHEKPQLGLPVSRPKFENITSRVQVPSVAVAQIIRLFIIIIILEVPLTFFSRRSVQGTVRHSAIEAHPPESTSVDSKHCSSV